MKTIEIFAEAVKFASEASDIPSDRILSESRAADIERFVRCFGIAANDIKNPKQVCDNPS